MAWIQDGGSNPWYANFNNTALDFITFNGVQVWASSYSFSITVSYKVGAIGLTIDISSPSECESEYTENILSYVSRFSISVSNVVGCDEIYFNPMGIANTLAAIKFIHTQTSYGAIWRNLSEDFYVIETNSSADNDFLIDRFYLTDTTPVPVGVGYSLYGDGNYHTVSSVQSDPSFTLTVPNGTVNNPQRALKYYHSINLPDSYYYEKRMDTAYRNQWGIESYGIYVPLTIQRGRMIKYIYPYLYTYKSYWTKPRYEDHFYLNEDMTITPSGTAPTSGAWS